MRLKDIGYLYGGLNGKSGDDFHEEDPDKVKPFIPFTNVFKNFKVDVSDVRYVAMEAGEIQNRVRQGDVLFLMSSEDYDGIGKPAVISDEVSELYLNSFCRGLRITKRNICPEFVNYYLNAHHCREQIRLEGRGFTRVNIKLDRIAGQELKLPPVVDQRRIVEYLDSRCAAIDRKVALLEQKRTAYAKLKRALINETVTRGLDKNAKLKDSGVDWIGKVPEGWAIMRIKDVACSVGSGGTPAAGNALFYADANGYNWVSISDMSNVEYVTKTEKLLTQAGVEDKQLTVFPPGTVLYSMYATIGRVSELAIPSTINQAILAITFSPKYCKGFIKYALKAFEPWAIAHTSESTQKNLNAEKVRRFFIAVPNAEEQRIIANYLDAKCARIDKVLVLVAKEIELYKKLKRSLIDEVVTGRRKVA